MYYPCPKLSFVCLCTPVIRNIPNIWILGYSFGQTVMLFAWIFLLVLTVYFYVKFIRPLFYWKKRGLQHETPWPILGNYWAAVVQKKHLADIQMDFYHKFSGHSYFGFYHLTEPAIFIRDPNLIKRILSNDFEYFMDSNGPDEDPNLCRTLISLKGEAWREMRSTLTPAFTISKIKNMFSFIAECAENLQNSIPKDQGVLQFNIRCLFSRFTNDVIASTAFGLKCEAIKNPQNSFYRMGCRLTKFADVENLKLTLLILFPFIYKMLKLSFISQKEVDYFENIIKETIITREKDNIYRPDMLHLLLRAKQGRLFDEDEDQDHPKKLNFTDEDITAQSLLFFLAGFDTIASTATYIAYELALQPDCQEKLFQEITGILEEHDGKVSYDIITHMKYMEQVVAETLRKWTPAFQPIRICTKDYHIDGFLVTKGTKMILPVISIHRDPNYFPNPDKFDPERFSEENKGKIKPGTYFPFGAGPRNCIGSRFALLEIKMLIFYILAKFEIVPTEQTVIPYKWDTSKMVIVPDKMYLGLKPRI